MKIVNNSIYKYISYGDYIERCRTSDQLFELKKIKILIHSMDQYAIPSTIAFKNKISCTVTLVVLYYTNDDIFVSLDKS